MTINHIQLHCITQFYSHRVCLKTSAVSWSSASLGGFDLCKANSKALYILCSFIHMQWLRNYDKLVKPDDCKTVGLTDGCDWGKEKQKLREKQ